jgi:hypothetical protein
MINNVHFGKKSKKENLKNIIEIIDYVITHFNKIKQAFIHLKCQLFKDFAKTVYNKIQEFIDSGEEYLKHGEKIKMSIQKLRRYQCTYEKIYFEYEKQLLLETRSQTMTALIEKKKIVSNRNCQEMKKHIKKFLINQLPLCQDVLEIVKSYCFYDKKTLETIKFVKYLQKHIVTLFDFAASSRKNGFHMYDDHDYHDDHDDGEYEDPDEDEHWSFCIDSDEVAFQAVNCRFCGNYWSQYSPDWAPHNILCNCDY